MTHEALRTWIFMTAAIGMIVVAAFSGKAKSQELEQRRMDVEQRLRDLPPSITPGKDAANATYDRIDKMIGDAERDGRPLDRNLIARELRAADRATSQQKAMDANGNGGVAKIINVDRGGPRFKSSVSYTTYAPGVGFVNHSGDE